MSTLSRQWTLLERLEHASIVAEIARLDPLVQAGDAAAWEQAKPLLGRLQELVRAAHKRAARPVAEGGR